MQQPGCPTGSQQVSTGQRVIKASPIYHILQVVLFAGGILAIVSFEVLPTGCTGLVLPVNKETLWNDLEVKPAERDAQPGVLVHKYMTIMVFTVWSLDT